MSDENALRNFLMDIDCLSQLDEWAGKFNMFDILKITRAEIGKPMMKKYIAENFPDARLTFNPLEVK